MLKTLVLVAGLFALQAAWLAVWMHWGWTELWPSCSRGGFYFLRGEMRPEFQAALQEQLEFYYSDTGWRATDDGRLLMRPAIRYLHVDYFGKYTEEAIGDLRDVVPGTPYIIEDDCVAVAMYALGLEASYEPAKYSSTLESLSGLVVDSDQYVFDVFSNRTGRRQSDRKESLGRADVSSTVRAAADHDAPQVRANGLLPQRPLTVLYRNDTRVYFDKGSTTPRSASRHRIDQVAAVLRDRPNLAFVVWGHADPEEAADEEAALNLGLKRAAAVRDLLIERGVARQSLTVSSRGYRAFMPLNREERTLSALRYVSVEEVMPR